MPLYRMLISQKEIDGRLVQPGELFRADSVPENWLTGEVLPHIPGSGNPQWSFPVCRLVAEPPPGPLQCVSCGGMIIPAIDMPCLHCNEPRPWRAE